MAQSKSTKIAVFEKCTKNDCSQLPDDIWSSESRKLTKLKNQTWSDELGPITRTTSPENDLLHIWPEHYLTTRCVYVFTAYCI